MASQRLKCGWYPQIPMMVAALITIVLSCASPSKKCFYVHPYTSAQAKLLEFEARLNDSVFYSEDVVKYDTAAYRNAVYDPYTGKFTGLENLRGPKLALSLVNKSNRHFMVPRTVDVSPDQDMGWGGATVKLYGRTLERFAISYMEELWLIDEDCASQFTEIAPGDTLVVTDTVDVFHLFRVEPAPVAGEYWLRVKFRDYLWCDTIPHVWIGETWSDTLRFRVVDEGP